MFFNKNEGWFFVIPLLIWLSLSILFPLYIAIDLSFYNVKITKANEYDLAGEVVD